MKLKINLEDKEYPFLGITHTRVVVRGIVLNKENKIAILKIERDDIFGKSSYYETPGGGKEDDETLEDGFVREIDEELGVLCEIKEEIGVVEDYYNLIYRKNINHYFLAKTLKDTKIHHESFGDSFIKDILWLSLDEAIELFRNMGDTGLPKIVKERELPVLLKAKELLGGN